MWDISFKRYATGAITGLSSGYTISSASGGLPQINYTGSMYNLIINNDRLSLSELYGRVFTVVRDVNNCYKRGLVYVFEGVSR